MSSPRFLPLPVSGQTGQRSVFSIAMSRKISCKFRQTNIRKLPHTLSYNLCFNVTRLRLETTAASEYLKTPDVSPPSNGSSMEDSLINSDETDVENNVSSNEHSDELSPEESFNCDERQVNGIRKASPSQTGITFDNFILGSITSQCSGKEPALFPRRGGTQTRHERAAEIEPNFIHAYIEIEKAVFLQLFREKIVG